MDNKGTPYPAQQPPPYSQQGPPGYAPVQQPGYVPGQQTIVVTQAPNVLVRQSFREVPVRLTCPSCQADVMTSTRYETGMLTWIAFGTMCIFGLWFGCCLIPFCVDACKDVVHSCPNCNQVVGRYNRVS